MYNVNTSRSWRNSPRKKSTVVLRLTSFGTLWWLKDLRSNLNRILCSKSLWLSHPRAAHYSSDPRNHRFDLCHCSVYKTCVPLSSSFGNAMTLELSRAGLSSGQRESSTFLVYNKTSTHYTQGSSLWIDSVHNSYSNEDEKIEKQRKVIYRRFKSRLSSVVMRLSLCEAIERFVWFPGSFSIYRCRSRSHLQSLNKSNHHSPKRISHRKLTTPRPQRATINLRQVTRPQAQRSCLLQTMMS